MQPQGRYNEISHFRAPYKDSVFNGYGVYERAAGRELHGVGEYLPVAGLGEYVQMGAFGQAATAEASSGTVASPIFQVVGNLQFATNSGDVMIENVLAPYLQAPIAIASPGVGGDVSVVAWIGYKTPPPGADTGPGPYVSLDQIFQTVQKGQVVLGDTTRAIPAPGKRSFLITSNPETIAKNARSGGLFFMSPGADPTLVTAAQKKVLDLYGPTFFASLGPYGTAGIVLGVGAALWFMFSGGKAKKSKRGR